jgi:plastocyanin
MNFFTSKVAGGSTVVNRLSSLWNSVGDFNWASFDLVAGLGQMFNLLTIVFMNIMLFLILLLFAVLFMARYIVIWILVILSPLAFAFYILPATKKWWTLWWTQLLQWSIIGVTCSFFLYLGDQLSALGPGVYGEAEGIGTAVLPFVVPVVFLIIGLIFGLQTGAMGASAVMGLTKRGGKWVGGKAWKGMALGDRKFLPSFDKDNKKFKAVSPRHAAGFITKKWEGIGNIPYAGRVLRPARWFLPEKLRDYGDYRTNIAAQGETIGPSPDAMYRVATGVYTGAKAAKVLSDIIRERGDGQDVIKAYMQKYNLKNEEDLLNDPRFLNDRTLIDALESISKAGDLSKVMRIEPRLTGVAAAGGLGSYKAFKGKDGKVDKFAAMKKAFEDIKPGDTAKWEREAVQNHDVIRAAMTMGDENLIRAIANNTKGGMKTVMKAWHGSYEEWVDVIEKKLREEGKIITKEGGRLTEDEARLLTPDKYIDDLETKFGVVKGSSGIRKAYSNVRMRSQGLELPRFLTPAEKGQTVTTPGAATGIPTPSSGGGTTTPTPKGRMPGSRKPGSTKKPSGRLPPDAYIG